MPRSGMKEQKLLSQYALTLLSSSKPGMTSTNYSRWASSTNKVAQSDILLALKGDCSFKADHGFVVYRLHLHDFIASGCSLHSARPAIDHGLCLQPLNHILNGLQDM